MRRLGLGVGWRPEIALWADRFPRLGFIELTVEHFPSMQIPEAVSRLLARGVLAIPHGLSLSLGGADPPERKRVEAIDALSRRVEAPLVSEHLAFVRSEGLESGHLLPVERTREAFQVVVENIALAKSGLSRPLALENIATLADPPRPQWNEPSFLADIAEASDSMLLLDVSNLLANSRNHGFDALAYLDRLPLERVAYLHVGGGVEHDGIYYDTHTHPVGAEVFELLEEVCARCDPPGVLLERDDDFPAESAFVEELTAIEEAVERGRLRREKS